MFKILYVDTLSAPQAQTNVLGTSSAYDKVGRVTRFDYRKLCRYFGPYLMNFLLYLVARTKKPDLIHLGKCESIRGETISNIKKAIDCKVIHFYGDFRDKPRRHVIDIGKYADITLLYHKDPEIVKQYKELGVKNIGFWWVGTNPEVYHPVDTPQEYDVVFFANNSDFLPGHEQRRQLIKSIADNGIEIHLFGNNWEIFCDYPGVFLHDFVVEEEFARACSKAKITLGYNAVNDIYFYASWRRPLNCMACETFHLTRYFPGLEEVFVNKKHLVWFYTIPEAMKLIKYYLRHTEQRQQIGREGRREVVEHHTWEHRIKEMIEIYNKLKYFNDEQEVQAALTEV